MITLISRWKLRNGCSPQLLQGICDATKAVEAGEQGTLMYSVHLPTSTPLDANNKPLEPQPQPQPEDVPKIVFVEIYRDADAFSCQIKGETFQGFKDKYLEYFYTSPANPGMPLTETIFLDRQAAFV